MKNEWVMLVRASVKSRRLQTAFYCVFIILATVLINLSVGVIAPLSDNLNNRIKNHIANREIVAEFEANTSDRVLNDNLRQMEEIEHVVSVYQMPTKITVKEQSGKLYDSYELSYVHRGYDVIISSGRSFDEHEKNVALVPENMKDFNAAEGRINEFTGETLIGTKLTFLDDFGNLYSVKVVGSYVDADPIFSSSDILIPCAELMDYNQQVLHSQDDASVTQSKSYIVQVDNYKNTDRFLEEVSKIRNAYRQPTLIDADMYQIALIILIVSLVFFVFLTIGGCYLFLKSNVNSRTSEMALYSALGYQSKYIFRILLFEYLPFGITSIVIGIFFTIIIDIAFVNPFLFHLVGNTLMEMEVKLSIIQETGILVFFLLILLLVFINAVKHSEKIDLSVLLREQ